ncbi:MAG: energy transducer TonB [Parvularcula sp.]|nr:M56 family metallopeptidase [Muricauda sp. UBA7809]MAW80586.1 energy transducer TonB [Parvularcula sp.]|tara:strand:+ start:6776 stop:8605 length:1830 start_codon:yes stop_codon:yes gene_type:complete
MITYILESLAFQLVFLLTYDLFLKKETFFQWNRAYLLGTFFLSLVLPWVKIEALQTTMPEELGNTTIFFTQLNGVVLGPEANETGFLQSLPWPYWVFGAGSIMAAIWFVHKLVQIRKLRKKGTVVHFVDFTKITVPNSSMAFSFFKSIFLGEGIKKEKELNIMAHELVHVKQRHTLDLLFFELARIAFWFNPLVYVYQNRIAELHEFIADAQAVKRDKKTHYEMLLSEAFNTQNISFVNQFFNQSLIKKRIVMLQKGKSKAIWQLKYVLLLPLVLGMLVYTSCENQKQGDIESAEPLLLDESVSMDPSGATDKIILNVGDLNALTEYEKEKRYQLLEKLRVNNEITTLEIVDKKNRSVKLQLEKGMDSTDDSSLVSFLEIVDRENGMVKNQVDGDSIENKDGAISVPFSLIDEVPVFPGCEDAEDKRACFNEEIVKHIKKHFNYPKEAQERGIQGRVSAIFIMDVEGKVVDIRTRGPHELLEKEAERILSRLPQMKPGVHKGKKVEVPFAIPITFRLPTQSGDSSANDTKDYMLVNASKINKQGKVFYEGTVTDKESLGLSGVTISIDGKESGVISNFNGVFSIEVENGDVLKFQYIGLPNKLIRIPMN